MPRLERRTGAQEPLVFEHRITIGHPGEVIANGSRPAFASRAFAGLGAHSVVMGLIIIEELLENFPRPDVRLVHGGVEI